jgi:hypothetical protein
MAVTHTLVVIYPVWISIILKIFMMNYSIATIVTRYGGFGISLKRGTPFQAPSVKCMRSSLIDVNDCMTTFLKSDTKSKLIDRREFGPFPKLEEANRIYRRAEKSSEK